MPRGEYSHCELGLRLTWVDASSFYVYSVLFCSACYGVIKFVMMSGAKGASVVVSGKLRAQRAKTMKFVDGYMKHSGQPVLAYVDSAVRHVKLRQGVLGIRVAIMLPHDPQGKQGPKEALPDTVSVRRLAMVTLGVPLVHAALAHTPSLYVVQIIEPKEEVQITEDMYSKGYDKGSFEPTPVA
jgi:ribosomal S3-like protein